MPTPSPWERKKPELEKKGSQGRGRPAPASRVAGTWGPEEDQRTCPQAFSRKASVPAPPDNGGRVPWPDLSKNTNFTAAAIQNGMWTPVSN
jgi:hypothetical protein